MILRISEGYLKYVDSCGQLFLQEAIDEGYLPPHFSSRSSKALTINYVNAVTDHYAEVLTKNFEKTVKEEVRKALDDKETEIKVDEKSLQSVQQAIKNLFGAIGK